MRNMLTSRSEPETGKLQTTTDAVAAGRLTTQGGLREAHQATRETTQEGLREVQPARLTQLREVQAGSSQAHHSTKMRRRTKPDLGGFSPVVPLKVVGFA